MLYLRSACAPCRPQIRLAAAVLCLSMYSILAHAAVINVSTSSQLSSAIANANPGDEIVIANGNYNGFTVARSGNAANRIKIRAENRGLAVITSGIIRFNKVSYVTVEGVKLTTSGGSQTIDGDSRKIAVWFEASQNCRFTRCRLQLSGHTGSTEWVMLSGASNYNRIDHCEFGPNSVDGHLIWPRGNETIPGVTKPSDRTSWANGNGPFNPNMARNTLVDHNYFHDHLPTVSNGGELIVTGAFGMTGDYQETLTIIEKNLFVNCYGDGEMISNKSSNNTIRYNTIRRCGGSLVSRSGNKTHIYGNFMLQENRSGSGGIRIHEMDHLVYNNYVDNPEGHALEVGDGDPYDDPNYSHGQVKRAKIFHNTFLNADSFDIGNAHPLSPIDLLIANNILLNTSFSGPSPAAGWTYSQNFIWPSNPNKPGFSVTNPSFTTSNGMQKLSPGSPAIGAANASFFPWLEDDMDGQLRSAPDIGADEFAGSPIGRQPLTTADVGVNGPEDRMTTVWEGERLTRSAAGATARVVAEDNASGCFWVSLDADGAGDFVDLTLPNLPAGTYDVSVGFKANTGRGIMSLRIDGTQIGGDLDQFASAAELVDADFGTVTIPSEGTHVLRATVTGKNAASSSFAISIDKIALVPSIGTVAAPVFNPPSGTYTSVQFVEITTTPAEATIHYTTDGSIPSPTNGTPYTDPITIDTDTVLRAMAFQSGMNNSPVTTGNYVINLPQASDPTFTPPEGSYSGTQSVIIATLTADATIRYTTDNSDPSPTSGIIYTGPVTVSSSMTLKAIAFKSGMTNSNIAAAGYTITGGPSVFEAENLSRTGSGAAVTIQTDANTSGGQWVALEADGTGDFVDFTLPAIPAGTYTLKMRFKSHPNRGILNLKVDGSQLGGTLDQYSATPAYPETIFGAVTFTSSTTHVVRLTVTGKNAAAGAFTLSADLFTLVPVTTLSLEAESLARSSSGATTSLQSDVNTSDGTWVALDADGTGDFVDYTLPNIPAGTYSLKLLYKGNANRGTLNLKVDGAQTGGTLDQYSANQTYPEATFGAVTFATTGSHIVRLTVTGKNTASSAFTLSADKFTLTSQ